MKNFYYYMLIFCVVLFINNKLFSQIENGSFEQWDTVPFLNPTGWATTNVLVLSVTQSTDAQNGSLSARMEMVEFFGERWEPTLQNVGFTNLLEARIGQLNFYYKLDLKNFARLEVYVTTWDSSAATQQISTSGSAEAMIKSSTADWTLLQLPIEYFSTEDIPAYFNVVFALIDSSESTDLSAVGSFALIDNITVDQLTSVEVIDNVPTKFNLSQNYPNPFNPSTKIEYSVPKEAEVNLSIYDILGKKVLQLVNQIQAAGNYRYEFNGSELSSGTYFVRLNAGEHTAVRKVMLLK